MRVLEGRASTGSSVMTTGWSSLGGAAVPSPTGEHHLPTRREMSAASTDDGAHVVANDDVQAQPSSPPAAASPPRGTQTRLTINLNPEAASFLKSLTEDRGITYTEAIRRALAVYKLVKEQTDEGTRVQFDDGHTVREVVLL